MIEYYYLVASLPHLKFDEASFITKREFLSECSKWLSKSDLKMIEAIDIDNFRERPGDPEAVKEWKSFDLSLRQDIAEIRKAKREEARFKMPEHLADVFEQDDPLSMEKVLAGKRWAFLEEKEFGHHFDITALMLYYLRLQILERIALFDREKGKGTFERLSEAVYE